MEPIAAGPICREKTTQCKYCPHGDWVFLPWRRGFVDMYERAAAVLAGNLQFAMPHRNALTGPYALTDGLVGPDVIRQIYSEISGPVDRERLANFSALFDPAAREAPLWRRSATRDPPSARAVAPGRQHPHRIPYALTPRPPP
ncbi:tyrosinase family protein [Acidovorax sacchari]|uniref:tyrosinase family protein n=1 Tax=Acidovorax sacchari TaxID=3230736 RepID=UPI0039E23292